MSDSQTNTPTNSTTPTNKIDSGISFVSDLVGEKKSWSEIKHSFKSIVSSEYKIETLLDDSFKEVDVVPRLRTQLYPHQKVVVRAMMDLENNCEFELKYSSRTVYNIAVNAGVLSEKVGSGKTFDILALIMLQPIPKGLGYDIEHIIHKPLAEKKYCTGLIIKKTFSYVYRPTLIFVGSSVIRQWADTIAKYTNLKTFVVLGIRELEKFMQMVKDKSIEQFDVVLIKNGTVSRGVIPANLKLLRCNTVSSPHIYGLIANIKGICWARVVIDDFDTIRLKENLLTINANFTWYVSSTRKTMKQQLPKNFTHSEHTKVANTMLYGNFPVANMSLNRTMYYHCNIRSNPEFLERSNRLCKPNFYAYTFKDPNIRLINIMQGMDEDMREVVEMINADAIETAAERLGIKTTSTAGIFEKILGDQYDALIFACKVIKFIEEQKSNAHLRSPWIDIETHGTYGVRRLEKFEDITFTYPDINDFLNGQLVKYNEQKNKAMNSLNRIKDHLTEGECPICSQELKDDCEGKVVIFKCCSVIICEICCFGTIFKKTHVGTCGNCRKECTLKDLIYINQEINLDELVQKVESGSFHKEVKEAAETATPVQVNSGRSQNYCKFDAIVDIIRGITPLNQKRVNMIIPQLMAGSSELPESNTRKVLIFANYDETLHRICDRLTDEKIDYERLGGTHKQIAEMVNRFQTSLNHNVLVICAAKYCAGLNLQMATDLIFAHLMVDENIETQVAGRLIRLGRQNAANFHYLMYESEYRAKIRLGRMQELE